jgi:hypothetical protein
MKPLVIPPAAIRDPNAVQMLSAWIAEKGQHCTINIGHWEGRGHDEVSSWGIFIADTIRHIANAMRDEYGKAVPDTIAGVLKSLHTELHDPTSDVRGEFSHGGS